LVELTTTYNARFLTDNNGILAFLEPGLMNQRVFFAVRSHGYQFAKDGFGYAGVALDVRPGGNADLKLKRVNIAERLYRITGVGLYRDSALVGEPIPLRQPQLNAQVAGQDSCLAAVYRGKIYWFWGDTTPARYPLGNFHTSGATSDFPANPSTVGRVLRSGLDPAVGVDLTYFTNRDGFCKPVANLPGEGMVWLDGLLVTPDEQGQEHLVAHYSRMKSLGERLEQGLVVWNDERQEFEKRLELPLREKWRCPLGHPVEVRENGGDWFYFLLPDRAVRVRADLRHVLDSSSYEAFTCLDNRTNRGVVRDPQGNVAWSWRQDAEPLSSTEERRLVESRQLAAADARFQFRDAASGALVNIHAGSVNWNAYRRKWILIGEQQGGTSVLGEIWFAEASSPVGPWGKAVKIVTHDKYSFYNPVHHVFFDPDGGRRIYFEGTYSTFFSGNDDPTAYYDYNQMMYCLDLADPRLAP
jgi:hypothetical protein